MTQLDDLEKLLTELRDDQRQRWSAGDFKQVEDYLGAHPELLAQPDALLDFIYSEFCLCEEVGRSAKTVDYLNRFPNLSEALGRLLAVDRALRAGDLDGSETASHDGSGGNEPPETSLYEPTKLRSPPSDVRLADSDVLPPNSDVIPVGPDETPTKIAGVGTGVFANFLRKHSSVGREFPLFAAMPRKVVRALQAQLREKRYAQGDYLMRQGEAGDSLLFVVEGEVQIRVHDKQGDTHLIDTSGPGNVLGEMALVTHEPRSADVIATEPVKVLTLSVDAFQSTCRRYPIMAQVLTSIIAERLGRKSRDALADKRLGDYVIKQRAGRGGMSVVYEAEHIDSRRRVALKMMSHRLVYDDTSLQMFQREADLVESFNHANIIRMHGRFSAFQTYFIVMDFADGASLDQTLRDRGPLGEDEVRRILGQVARAINYAHQRHVIHRDLKPANIMLGRDGTVKLMDFGLAMPLDEPAITGAGAIVGTPGYMSPEQMRGERVTPATDYFSLGVVTYEMLMNRRLFPARSFAELLTGYDNWTSRGFKYVCPQVSDEFADALDQCLAADPSQRRLDLERLSAWADG